MIVPSSRAGRSSLAAPADAASWPRRAMRSASFGVHSAMPMSEALRRCPHAICIPPRMRRYKEVSRQVFAVFHEFTPPVEGLSLDEAFLDLTREREAVRRGIATSRDESSAASARRPDLPLRLASPANKLLAKIASDLAQARRLRLDRARRSCERARSAADSTPSGVGKKTAARLEEHGIHTLGQLRTGAGLVLWPLFGRFTQRMRERASGIDERPSSRTGRKTRSAPRRRFEHDIRNHDAALCGARAVSPIGPASDARAPAHGRPGVREDPPRDFTTYTRQQTFSPPTQDSRVIVWIASRLLRRPGCRCSHAPRFGSSESAWPR